MSPNWFLGIWILDPIKSEPEFHDLSVQHNNNDIDIVTHFNLDHVFSLDVTLKTFAFKGNNAVAKDNQNHTQGFQYCSTRAASTHAKQIINLILNISC
jgi:hypothetical protein